MQKTYVVDRTLYFAALATNINKVERRECRNFCGNKPRHNPKSPTENQFFSGAFLALAIFFLEE